LFQGLREVAEVIVFCMALIVSLHFSWGRLQDERNTDLRGSL